MIQDIRMLEVHLLRTFELAQSCLQIAHIVVSKTLKVATNSLTLWPQPLSQY